jgi:hypothetical protein
MARLLECRMANLIYQASGDYAAVEEDSEAEQTTARLLEHVANGVDKGLRAHKPLPRRRPVEANAAAWFRLFLPTEFLSQRLEMPVKGFRTICRSSPGRQIY